MADTPISVDQTRDEQGIHLQDFGREVSDSAGDHKVKMEAKQLSVYYGPFQALSKIDLQIREHAITALIGPSGCGKSTLLRSFNRMNDLVPTAKVEGQILLDGEDIYSPSIGSTEVRRKVGMVFQKPNPFPNSIWENVAYGPKLYGINQKKVLDQIVYQALEDAALWDEVKDKLHQSGLDLSGGQQQRLCIARALAMEPEVVLMDEPASALDPIATARIEDLMQELKKTYTIVIVTHNMQQAARSSDFTGFLMMNEDRAGFLVEYGPTQQLFIRPKHKQTEDYVTGRFG